jgi:hypothetical protein
MSARTTYVPSLPIEINYRRFKRGNKSEKLPSLQDVQSLNNLITTPRVRPGNVYEADESTLWLMDKISLPCIAMGMSSCYKDVEIGFGEPLKVYFKGWKGYVIDTSFNDKFNTAYASVSGLPSYLHCSLADYNTIVYRLSRKIQWYYDDLCMDLPRHRRHLYEKLLNIQNIYNSCRV